MHALMRTIAAAYDRAPLHSAAAEPAWRALADHSMRHASILRRDYLVIEVDDGSPYPDATAMFRDIGRGRVLISSINSVHPVWTVRENVAFRLVHDVLGHYAAYRSGRNADFTWEGEMAAFDWHERTVPPGEARDALFTEVLGQAAYSLARGSFGDQKVTFLW